MTVEVDMTNVDPVRREETLRRVAVVKRYLALPRPSKEKAIALAAELGLKRNQFLVLVRAWAEHGKASALPGAQRRYSFLWEESRKRIHPEVEKAIEAAIAELGCGGTTLGIQKRATALCEAQGLPGPAFNAVRPRLEAARQAFRASPDLDPVVLIGRVALDVPVVSEDGRVMPAVAALAVSARYGHVLAFDAGTADAPGSIAKVLIAVVGGAPSDAQAVRLRIAVARGAERQQLEGALKVAGLGGSVVWVGPKQPMDTAQGALGGRMGGLRLTMPKALATAMRAPKLETDLAAPVQNAAVLAEVVGAAVGRHNRSGPRSQASPPPISFGDDLSKAMIARALAGFS